MTKILIGMLSLALVGVGGLVAAVDGFGDDQSVRSVSIPAGTTTAGDDDDRRDDDERRGRVRAVRRARARDRPTLHGRRNRGGRHRRRSAAGRRRRPARRRVPRTSPARATSPSTRPIRAAPATEPPRTAARTAPALAPATTDHDDDDETTRTAPAPTAASPDQTTTRGNNDEATHPARARRPRGRRNPRPGGLLGPDAQTAQTISVIETSYRIRLSAVPKAGPARFVIRNASDDGHDFWVRGGGKTYKSRVLAEGGTRSADRNPAQGCPLRLLVRRRLAPLEGNERQLRCPLTSSSTFRFGEAFPCSGTPRLAIRAT